MPGIGTCNTLANSGNHLRSLTLAADMEIEQIVEVGPAGQFLD